MILRYMLKSVNALMQKASDEVFWVFQVMTKDLLRRPEQASCISDIKQIEIKKIL